jgi:hypothetical protein
MESKGLFGLMTNLPHFATLLLPKVSSSIRTNNLRQSVARLATNQTALKTANGKKLNPHPNLVNLTFIPQPL